ncbi:hypothetical protein Pcinc_025809 [Petrolisthes cinctipes]|uniref:Uncharacterized protein n=1 Tax=Petrolisthes cinctipes TaxID=88211 RepID=A0AAE1F7Z8_PETCI|nr:hypothetical protein Pcinc_025809 [Petrolisthes cinctipes]
MQRELAEVKMAAVTSRLTGTGCARRNGPGSCLYYCAASTTSPVCFSHQPSPTDVALRKSVATLMSRCTAFENRFSALVAWIDGLVAPQAANNSKLYTLVEARQAIISTAPTPWTSTSKH